MNDFFEKILGEKAQQYTHLAMDYIPRLILAFVILIVGLKIIARVSSWIFAFIDKSSLGPEIKPFIKSTLSFALKITLFFIVAGLIGIETTKFVALLGAVFFAIGMGLQGSLGHFAAGLLILIFKPYKVGDVVEIQGQLGIVKDIQIINTHVELFDVKMAIIPNGIAISDILVNHSYRGLVRVDTSIAIPYHEDFEKVKEVILEAVSKTDKVLTDPAPFVGIQTFDTHNIELTIWPYAKTADYWDVLYAVNASVKKAFSEHKIQMAYSEGIELGEIGP